MTAKIQHQILHFGLSFSNRTAVKCWELPNQFNMSCSHKRYILCRSREGSTHLCGSVIASLCMGPVNYRQRLCGISPAISKDLNETISPGLHLRAPTLDQNYGLEGNDSDLSCERISVLGTHLLARMPSSQSFALVGDTFLFLFFLTFI
jgi:hypothetical protein